MKSATLIVLGLLAFVHAAAGIDITIEPLPPVGCEIVKSKDDVVHLNMEKAGTAILGHCKVEALPENYIIIFTAEGMGLGLSSGDVSLVIYATGENKVARRAHSGKVLIPTTSGWSNLKTSYLAKGTKQYDQIILAMHCDSPCKVQLRDFKVQAMTRREFDARMDAQLKKAAASQKKSEPENGTPD